MAHVQCGRTDELSATLTLSRHPITRARATLLALLLASCSVGPAISDAAGSWTEDGAVARYWGSDVLCYIARHRRVIDSSQLV